MVFALNCGRVTNAVFSLDSKSLRLCLTAVLTHGLQALGDDMRNKFLGGHERILAWIDNVKKATSPHFDEAHVFLFEVKAQMQSKAAAAAAAAAKQGGSEASSKLKFASKL